MRGNAVDGWLGLAFRGFWTAVLRAEFSDGRCLVRWATYWKHGMDEAQRKRIEAYVDLSDREVEPVFVGRADLFETVASAARACADGHPRGQTVCLAGPPGIGKTAFIEALRTRGLDGWEGPPTLVVDVDPWRLHDARFVLERVALALAEKDAVWRRVREKGKAAGARVRSFSILGIGGAIDPKVPKADFLAEGLARALDGAPGGFAVCLAVDEAHQLRQTPGREANELLAMIHAGVYADYPLFVLLAGHSQTPDVIRRSVSRRLAGGRLHHMQPLSGEEARTYLARIMDHLGLQGPARTRRRLIDWLAAECGGVPQHLRSAMTALGREVLAAGSPRLRDLDAAHLAEDVTRQRTGYYEGRLADLEEALPLVRTLLGKWGPEGVPRAQAKDDAQALIMRQDAERTAQLRDAGLDTGPDLVGAMISRGLLAGGDGGRWRCLIPSLRQYALTGTFRTAPPPRPSGSIPR